MTPLPVKGAGGKRVHLYIAGRSTACGRAVDVDRWTVRAQRLVSADEWCGICWNRVLG